MHCAAASCVDVYAMQIVFRISIVGSYVYTQLTKSVIIAVIHLNAAVSQRINCLCSVSDAFVVGTTQTASDLYSDASYLPFVRPLLRAHFHVMCDVQLSVCTV